MILEQINSDLVAAMKDREPSRKEENQLKVMTLRTLLAEVKSFLVNNRREPTDQEVSGILAKAIKQFRETLDNASGKNAAGVVREDIAQQERAKIALLEKYLPAQMSKAEIEDLVQKAIVQAGASGPKDMGAVMALIRPQTQGRADGKLVSEVVKAKLSGG
ncbi:MAG TPA: GatB/YqeY domain-containing protein [Fibrobacteria bacterium]|nr:GatB/YqeY domain-containing protein [Fibrobacteria bacterium]